MPRFLLRTLGHSASFSALLLIVLLNPSNEVVSVVVFASDKCVEVRKQNGVVALRLVENLLADRGVEVLKQGKDLPKAKRDALLLQFGLEDSSVDSLIQQHGLLRPVNLVLLALCLRPRQVSQLFDKRLLDLFELDFSPA
jgi:hypothetical protein